MSRNQARPLLRYHGGKWRLAPWIIAHLPAHAVYVEPFAGAGSVLLRKPRSYCEVLNDLDGDVVNLFRVLRERPEQLRLALTLTPFAREEFQLAYEPAIDPLERARRTVVRSAMGFGSAAACGEQTGFRMNSTRSGSTPVADFKSYPDALGAIAERLRGVIIENLDFRELFPRFDQPETLFYCDPPYVLATRKRKNLHCRKGYRHEMTDSDHEALAKLCESSHGKIVVSGYACPLYDDLFGHWQRVERQTFADSAAPRVEVLFIKP